MKYWRWVTSIFLVIASLICCLSCSLPITSKTDNSTRPASSLPAQVDAYKFEVGNISVIPQEARVGTFMTVSLPVRNIGSRKNAFIATLYVDGNEYITRDITLAPGNGGSLTYVLSNLGTGTHEISVAGVKSSLIIYAVNSYTIPNNKDYRLHYTSLEYTPLPPLPHLSTDHFTPPVIPFFITRIDFRYPYPQSFEIIDSRGKQLYSAENAYQAGVIVPDIQVNGDFSIQMQTSQPTADVRSEYFGFNSWRWVIAYYWPEVSTVEGIEKSFSP